MADSDGLLTQVQLAKKLKVSQRTIERWQSEKGMPVVRVLATRPRYDWNEVRQWIREQSKLNSKATANGVSDA